MGEDLLRESLQDEQYKDIPPILDLLFERREGLDTDRQASAIAALGMIYEGAEDLAEAGAYYRRALELNERQTMAAAGQYRIEDPDTERRRKTFNDQRWCYPYVRRDVGSHALSPCSFIKSMSTGDIWHSLLPELTEDSLMSIAQFVFRDAKLDRQIVFNPSSRMFEPWDDVASLVYKQTGSHRSLKMYHLWSLQSVPPTRPHKSSFFLWLSTGVPV